MHACYESVQSTSCVKWQLNQEIWYKRLFHCRQRKNIPVTSLTAEYASWRKPATSILEMTLEGFRITPLLLFACVVSAVLSEIWCKTSTFSITDQTPWVTELNSKKHFSFFESTKKTATLVIGHPSTFGFSLEASKTLDISHACIMAFSITDSWFSGSSNSLSLDICMNLRCPNKAGFRITANLQNELKPKYSSAGFCFLW